MERRCLAKIRVRRRIGHDARHLARVGPCPVVDRYAPSLYASHRSTAPRCFCSIPPTVCHLMPYSDHPPARGNRKSEKTPGPHEKVPSFSLNAFSGFPGLIHGVELEIGKSQNSCRLPVRKIMFQRRRHRIRHTGLRLIVRPIALRQYPVNIRLPGMKSVLTFLITDKKENHKENSSAHTQPGNRKDRIDLICPQISESSLEEMDEHRDGIYAERRRNDAGLASY